MDITKWEKIQKSVSKLSGSRQQWVYSVFQDIAINIQAF